MSGILNLHNHTPFSDGAYTIDELCEAHLALEGVEVAGIGISDHLFCTPSSRAVSNPRDFERIFVSEARDYVEEVRAARERWDGKLLVGCGCEINWPLNRPHLDVIRQNLRGIDYVLFENVDWAGLTQLANQSRRWPCPIGLAHTDIAAEFPNTSMDQVIRTMANARIFYEVNSRFLPVAPQDRWMRMLPRHRVYVSFGTDTHDDLGRIADLGAMTGLIETFGLQDKLFLPRFAREDARADRQSA